jgi:anti-anti-sigma factor
MKIDVRFEGEYLVVLPHEDIDLANSSEFDDFLSRKIESGVKKVILDFSEVRYIDSSGIGAIVRVHRDLKERNGEIVISQCNDSIQKIFKLINFHRYFRLSASVEEALLGK